MRVQVFTFHGRTFMSHPRLNLTRDPGGYVNSSAFRQGGGLLGTVQFFRAGPSYKGGAA